MEEERPQRPTLLRLHFKEYGLRAEVGGCIHRIDLIRNVFNSLPTGHSARCEGPPGIRASRRITAGTLDFALADADPDSTLTIRVPTADDPKVLYVTSPGVRFAVALHR